MVTSTVPVPNFQQGEKSMRRTINVVLFTLAALALLAGCGNLLNPGSLADSTEGTMVTIGFPSLSRVVNGDPLFSEDYDVAYLKLWAINLQTGLNEEVPVNGGPSSWYASYRVKSGHYGQIIFKARAYYSGWWDEYDNWHRETLVYKGSVTVNVPGTNQVTIPMVAFYPTTFTVTGLSAYANTPASLLVFQQGTDLQAAIDEALADMDNPPSSMVAQADNAYIDETGTMYGSFYDWVGNPNEQYDIYVGILNESDFSMTILAATETTPLATLWGSDYWEFAVSGVYEYHFSFPTQEWVVSDIPELYRGLPAALYVFPGNTYYPDLMNGSGSPIAAGFNLSAGPEGTMIDENGTVSGVLVRMDSYGGELPFWYPDPALDYDVVLMVMIPEDGEYVLFGVGTDFSIPDSPIINPLATISGSINPWYVNAAGAVEYQTFAYPVADEYEPDNEPADAKEITLNETQYRSLTYADTDWVKIYAEEGSTYLITTNGENPWWRDDNQMWLYDSSFNELQYNNNYYNQYAGIEFEATYTGWYFIEIGGLYEDKIGDYTLTLSPGGGPY
jgi:hypothetical protein